jgi:D-glycero-alpha-D-manno-heptose-7-phosphate kinase
MAEHISNAHIDAIYKLAKEAGATGGKISGAGGGGFMIFYCPGNTRYAVINALGTLQGRVRPYSFTQQGVQTWSL